MIINNLELEPCSYFHQNRSNFVVIQALIQKTSYGRNGLKEQGLGRRRSGKEEQKRGEGCLRRERGR